MNSPFVPCPYVHRPLAPEIPSRSLLCISSGELGAGIEEDNTEAIKWLQKAATKENRMAQKELENIEMIGQMVKDAKKGNPVAQCKLGKYYQDDFDESIKWYRKAAEQGLPEAQFELGYCYDNGEGVEQNPSEAAKWYRKAAEQGHAEAQYYMGYCCLYGYGVEKDETEAIKWIRKAAEQGNDMAQDDLEKSQERGASLSITYCFKSKGVEEPLFPKSWKLEEN